MRATVIAKTESWWDSALRFVGWHWDVKTDRYDYKTIKADHSRTMAYGIQGVVGLSQLPAAQALYQKVCQ